MSELAASKFLLRRWKRGVGEYRPVIFAKKSSGMSQLADLRGKTMVFEKPFSSSGYFFPKLALMEAGLKPMPKKEPSDAVAASEVGYVFSNADENTMTWVLRGRVSAGATDHQSYAMHARSILRIWRFSASQLLSRVISLGIGRGLPDRLVLKIKETLLAMDKSETGGKALLEFQQTVRVDPIPAEFNDLIYKSAPFLRHEREPR